MITLEQYKAGKYQQGYNYTYFLPNPIHDDWSWTTADINVLLENAALRLGALNAYARFVPNIDLFIKLHVTKEAVVSSQIEGTRTNLDEALLPQTEIHPERQDDWIEVTNYVRAMNMAIERLETLPLSSRLIRDTHRILLSGARGTHKLPGEFRRSQNWIGGRSLTDAVFIPPQHNHLQDLMADLEHFLHNRNIPALIRIAIAHYQFETIHPFLDGNGRIGRLLITLFLVSEGILAKPLLYMSSWFDEDRSLYYASLNQVRTHHEMIRWVKYFLNGIEQIAVKAIETLNAVLNLKEQSEETIRQSFGRRTKKGMRLLDYLFTQPIISVEEAKNASGLTFKSANDLVKTMVEHGILIEITGQSRNRLFQFKDYLDAFTR